MKPPTILVLGGYGAAGRRLCRLLLYRTDARVVVAGRSLARAENLAEELTEEFSEALAGGRTDGPEQDLPGTKSRGRVDACHADASDPESLARAFAGIDLVIVASSTADWTRNVAESALEAGADYLDILYDQRAWGDLRQLASRIEADGRCFVSQAGFHPGLPSAYIRRGAAYFDRYERARVAIAMNARIDDPAGAAEILDSLADWKPVLFEQGAWRPATWRDSVTIDFGSRFGRRSCVPMDLAELRGLPEPLGLSEAGIFVAGFNWFVDWVLFPVVSTIWAVRPKAGRRFWSSVFAWGLRTFSGPDEGVTLILEAGGVSGGVARSVRMTAQHDDVYDFTVIPVVAAVEQLLDVSVRKPGLWMMGHLVDPERLIDDMTTMGADTVVTVR